MMDVIHFHWHSPFLNNEKTHLETESVGVALVISWGLNQAIWRCLMIFTDHLAIKDGAEDTSQMLMLGFF